MKIVSLVVETYSMLPEWAVSNAVLLARRQEYTCASTSTPTHEFRRAGPGAGQEGAGPSFCCKFSLKLRLQRKPNFYITQVFLVSILILTVALFPMAFRPDLATDRFAMHVAGLLTLVAFKYSVTSELPVVPYTTFTSVFLTLEIVTIVCACAECVVSYKIVICWKLVPHVVIEYMEDGLLLIVLCCWYGVFFLGRLRKRFQELEGGFGKPAHGRGEHSIRRQVSE